MNTLNSEHIKWCRRLFDSLQDRGEWTIPRTFVTFQRQGDRLVLIRQMPYDPTYMRQTREAYERAQQLEFEAAVYNFGAVGIEVVRGTRKET